jgi:murein DD-endopeptidase MepM/ murein hydrolase activator NlpD
MKEKLLLSLLLLSLVPLALIFQPKSKVKTEVSSSPTVSTQPATPNTECKISSPVSKGLINQRFGVVPNPRNSSKTHFHAGVDFDGALGESVKSVTCGTVIFSGRTLDKKNYNFGYGERIEIEDEKGQVHLYAHLSRRLVKVGDKIKSGQVVGAIGNSGLSTNYHLHYEIRSHNIKIQNEVDLKKVVINPINFLNKK